LKRLRRYREALGELLSEPVQVLIIGGAAMLQYGLKDVTKDNGSGLAKMLRAKQESLKPPEALGFSVIGPEKRHSRLDMYR
jgi:hypothetical protein